MLSAHCRFAEYEQENKLNKKRRRGLNFIDIQIQGFLRELIRLIIRMKILAPTIDHTTGN